MPATVAEFVDLLELTPQGPDAFVARQPASSLQRVFGGQVLAQALAAAYETMPDGRRAHSLNAYFVRPGDPDQPIVYGVQDVLDGRSFSNRRVTALQGERTIFALSASFHVPEPGLDHADPTPLDVPAPETCPLLSEVLGSRSAVSSAAWRQEWGVLEARYAGETAPHRGRGMRVWVRVNGALPDDARLHQMALAHLSDLTLLAVSVVGHPVQWNSPQLMAASIDHSMWFHRPARADQWLLYDEISPSASNALGFSLGRLFQGEALVASCAQEGLIRLAQ